jgi:P pilus assembly chaperone PapD
MLRRPGRPLHPVHGRTTTLFLRFFLFAALLSVCAPAAAFVVQPIVSVLDLPKDNRGVAITVQNTSGFPLPLAIEVVERSIRDDGSEEQTPADELFNVFPPQAVLQPGQSQTIRVQWVGDIPAKSRSFTLYASQVPVDVSQFNVSGVQRVLRIGSSIHVTDRKSMPRPSVVSAVPADGGMRVTLGNSGDRFVYIDSLALQFGADRVEGEALGKAAGRTLLPPGATRTFVVPGVSGTPTVKLLD